MPCSVRWNPIGGRHLVFGLSIRREAAYNFPGRAVGSPTAPPQTRASPIKALGSSVKWIRFVDGVNDPRTWQREPGFEQLAKTPPTHVLTGVGSSFQPLVPQFLGQLEHLLQTWPVSGNSEIGVMPSEFGRQLSALLGHIQVPILLAPLPNPFDRAFKPRSCRLALDHVLAT